MMSSVATESKIQRAVSLQGVDPETCMIVFKNHWAQVLATGLSGLYSSLPTKLEEKGEGWHCLLRDDWLLLPPLVQFMNSLEFCNAVIQVAHPLIRNQLVNYIYNGFLVPVLAPALHKVTVEEVMTTTAYLDLFLRSISEPALLEIFLRFILLHQHENVHILDTLTSRINTPFRLCVVSLALFRTLIGLHCEDVMLQLILRYLIPCNHMMLSQRWAVKERDCYSVSAAKLLALTPVCCSSGITLTLGNQERDYILWSKCTHDSPGPTEQPLPEAFPPSACIVEYGKALDISYLQYLWEAHSNILRCMRDCRVWSALYDGDSPDPEAFCLGPPEERAPGTTSPVLRLPQQVPGTTEPPLAPRKEKSHTELEWDDSYDTGISSGTGGGSPGPYEDAENASPPAPVDPPKHIQEMKKNAILLFKGAYIEESDFQDDVMVYRLCAEKDAEDACGSQEDSVSPPAQIQVQSAPLNNGPLPGPEPETDSEEEHSRDDSAVLHSASRDPAPASEPEASPEPAPASAAPSPEAEPSAQPTAAVPEGEDFMAQYDQIIKELGSSTEGLMERDLSSPDALLVTKEPEGEGDESQGGEEDEGKKDPEEDDDDFDSFIAEAPPSETPPPPFGARDDATFASHRPARTQSTPFTGPFISVVLSKLENMLENSLHVNLLLIGIITQLASYPQPLLRSFLLNTNMVFQPSVRSLYQVLASVKNKIEQFASVERDFPGLLIQAQQYLLFRVDLSDPSPETPTKDPVQDASRTGSGKNFLDGPPRVLQPFLTNRAKVVGAPPSLPPPVRDTMLAAALFPEFLKELAALAQEHSILCCRMLGDPDDACW